MKNATATIVGLAPYSQSAVLQSPKEDKESHDDYDERCWREHCTTGEGGIVVIPPAAIKGCLESAARYLSERIPGQGSKKWTQKFECGVLCIDPPWLLDASGDPIHIDDVDCERLFLNADGRRGGSTRVWKRYPVFREWRANIQIVVADDSIKSDLLERYLREAGRFIGIGRYRPEKRGWYGRFAVEDFDFSDG